MKRVYLILWCLVSNTVFAGCCDAEGFHKDVLLLEKLKFKKFISEFFGVKFSDVVRVWSRCDFDKGIEDNEVKLENGDCMNDIKCVVCRRAANEFIFCSLSCVLPTDAIRDKIININVDDTVNESTLGSMLYVKHFNGGGPNFYVKVD